MKRKICMILCLTVLLSSAGCGSGGAREKTPGGPAGVSDVLEAGMAAADGRTAGEEPAIPAASETPQPAVPAVAETAYEPGSIDLDLTALSSTMVYSEVYNIMARPEDYIGKVLKMKGLFTYYHDEVTGNYYFACIIQDATACCAQGIEFVLTDDYVYPDDYPRAEEEICVVGVFDTYQEGPYTYCTLRNARLV